MSETAENTENTADAGDRDQQQDHAGTFSQEDVDRIVADRLSRERKKFEGYEDYKAKADALDGITAERDELAKKVAEHEARVKHDALVAEVAESKGVPASMLRGSTREEMEAHADAILPHLRPSVPRIPGAGVQPEQTPESADRQFIRNLFSAAKAQ